MNANHLLGTHNILFITFDTLRYDVAMDALREGRTPKLQQLLPGGIWEKRLSPGSFTYAAHHAFFAGFLPTPIAPGNHPRLFAVRFPGSETIDSQTLVFDAPNIIQGFAIHGYHTVCIGGVGFFNKQSPLGSVLPSLFGESHWREDFGVTCKESADNQVALALEIIHRLPSSKRLLLFVNLSAMHQPNCIYMPGATHDTPLTQAAALAYVDKPLARLVTLMRRRAPLLAIFCSDHGTAYGEDGYRGHRVAHPVVWTVPYAEMLLAPMEH